MPEAAYIDIKKLSPYEKNPRKISRDQFKKLCNSIEEDPEFFDARPCLVNHISDSGKMVVYAGNQRVLAAKKLGWKQVPCRVESDLDDAMMKARMIKDNKHYGEFDYDMLANEFEVEMLLDAGFTEAELSFSQDVEQIDEEKPEKKSKCVMCPSCGFEFESKKEK